jgi:uncharacterized protein
MLWYHYAAAAAAGFLCGIMNTLAGSGSLVTLPVLLMLGLPASVANGTNRVGVLIQSAVATASFRQQRVFKIREGLLLMVPTALGSTLGARISLTLNEESMRRTIGILMVIMLFVVLIDPKRWLRGKGEITNEHIRWWHFLLFFVIGVYGGFIQVGIGIFLLSSLVLGVGYDLVKGNAVKVLIVAFQSLMALIIFVLNDQVIWTIGLALAVGQIPGAWVASRLAVKWGAAFVRWVLIAIVIVSASSLFGVLDFIGHLFG